MEIRLCKEIGLTGLRVFTKAKPQFDLGRGVISLGGNRIAGYMTTIPISDASYRRNTPTKASARHELINGLHTFRLTDDWGHPYTITISDDEEGRALAERQKESLAANELLKPELKP